MKTLKFKFDLDSKVSIYVPSTQNVSEQLREHFEDVYAIAERIKHEMTQEAVTLEINGQVKFV